MHIPKKYFQDRIVLLLLSVNTFLAVLSAILILLRLDTGAGKIYYVQFRGNLNFVDAFQFGSANTFIAFILFSFFVLIFHTLLSMRAYHIRRHFAIAVLGMGLLLLTVCLIVSNALINQ